MLTNPRVRGHSRSLKMVPFYRYDTLECVWRRCGCHSFYVGIRFIRVFISRNSFSRYVSYITRFVMMNWFRRWIVLSITLLNFREVCIEKKTFTVRSTAGYNTVCEHTGPMSSFTYVYSRSTLLALNSDALQLCTTAAQRVRFLGLWAKCKHWRTQPFRYRGRRAGRQRHCSVVRRDVGNGATVITGNRHVPQIANHRSPATALRIRAA